MGQTNVYLRWSLFGAGEEKFSYGYGGTGKASTDCKFQDYGEKFTVDDVIGAYLVSVASRLISLSLSPLFYLSHH